MADKGPPRPGDPRPRAARRSLSHVGGASATTGDPAHARALAEALDVPTSEEAEEAARAHVHGFHSYPARMHPLTARRLVEALSRRGAAVLDPFCGSGTVVVEARLAGRRAFGVDANPLAVRLAELKARAVGPADRQRLREAAQRVAATADERRKARAGPSRRYGKEDMALFDTHVLLELDGLRVGLDALDARTGRDLELVLSSILTKVSRKTSDTSAHAAPRRIAAGYPAKLFVKKTEELCRRLEEVEPTLAAAPPARVVEGDARVLAGIADRSIALVATSPPYPGTYDYLAHHEARLRWLRLRTAAFESAEIGSRRRLDALGAREGRARWAQELESTLGAMRRVLEPGGLAVLLRAGGGGAGEAVYAIDVVTTAASAVRLAMVATASQERPHFHGPSAQAFARRPRREHAILLGCPA